MHLESLLHVGEFESIQELLLRQVWQVSLLIAIVFVIAKTILQRRPQLAYVLWMLVLIKAVTPPIIATPLSPWNWLQSPTTTAALAVDDKQTVHQSATVSPSTLPVHAASLASGQVLSATQNESIVATTRSTIGKWLACAWLLGSVVLALGYATKWIRFTKQLANECSKPSPLIERLVQEQAKSLGIHRSFQVRITESFGPAVFGVLKPIILLPTQLCDSADMNSLRPIISHELIHLRRRDTVHGLVQTVVQIAWWFHPLVWIANREIRRERERCCDCEVIARTKHRPIEYARSLVSAIELCNLKTERLAPSLIGATGAAITEKRLIEIMRRGDNVKLPRPVIHCVLVAVCAFLLFPSAPIRHNLHAEDRVVVEGSTKKTKQNPSSVDDAETAAEQSTRSGPAQFGVRNAPPVVVRTMPIAGADNVDPKTTQLKVTFSKPMEPGSWSWVRVNEESFPTIIGEPRYTNDRRTCVADVQLDENTTYAIWLNHERYRNFRDAAGQSAVPYLFVFRTGSR